MADVPGIARYTGPGYGFGPDPTLTLGPKTDANVIVASIANILSTPKGTIPYDPNLGSQIPNLLFELELQSTMALIRYYAFKELGEQEPRIVVQDVSTELTDEHTVTIKIGFSIVGDPTAQRFLTPIVFNRS